MLWFTTKKRVDDLSLTSQERLTKLEHRLTLLEAEILDLATAQNIIRDKVLRKIQFKKEETEEKNTDAFKGMLVPDNHVAFR